MDQQQDRAAKRPRQEQHSTTDWSSVAAPQSAAAVIRSILSGAFVFEPNVPQLIPLQGYHLLLRKCNTYSSVCELWQRMLCDPASQPDQASYSLHVTALCRCRELQAALNLLRNMNPSLLQARTVEPILLVLSDSRPLACPDSDVLWVWNQLVGLGALRSLHITAALKVCSSRSLDVLKQILRDLVRQGVLLTLDQLDLLEHGARKHQCSVIRWSPAADGQVVLQSKQKLELLALRLTAAEKSQIQKLLLERPGTAPGALNKCLDALKKVPSLTAVIDGANVGYCNQNRSGGAFNYNQIDKARATLEANGIAALIILPRRYLQPVIPNHALLSSKKLKLSRERLALNMVQGVELQAGDPDSTTLTTKQLDLIESWKLNEQVYECDDELDDLFFLVATTMLHTDIRAVTNDQLRDHLTHMDTQLSPQLLRRWKHHHIARYQAHVVDPAPLYSVELQISSDGWTHAPVLDASKGRCTCVSIHTSQLC
jgi:hypothetical protein